jgi:hypothetical protein
MNMLKLTVFIGAWTVAGLVAAEQSVLQPPVSPSPDGASLYFISPGDGAEVGATFIVKFGLSGMGVAPAGVDSPNTGHHHLLIDHPGQPAANQPLPATEQVRHFGGGQTEVELTLAPGTHRLQLLLGNYLHIPHDPPVSSAVITITVMP